MMSLGALGELVELLRTRGVRYYREGDVSLEFEASTPPPARADSSGADEASETCRCGHGMHAHNQDGLCIHGCAVEVCAGPEDSKER